MNTTERTRRAKTSKARRVTAAAADSDRIAALHEQLAERTAALVNGSEWRAMLSTAAQFYRYSLGNILLIAAQRPDATRIAGYRTWQRLGRQVRKGERGITILAPCRYRPDDTEEPGGTDPIDGQEQQRRVLRGFRTTHVFDISQTDGDPLPDIVPVLLDGDDPGPLWDALAAQVTDAGYSLTRGDCRGANGLTMWAAREVRVRDDVSAAQACKTLAHELAHVLLHQARTTPRDREEVEAESVAYIVCHAAGLATDDYSLPYVATWANGDLTLLRDSAQTVLATARTVLDRVAEHTGSLTDPITDTSP